MRSQAMAIDWRPELQKRLMVTPVVVTGRPARRAAIRAMLLPDSASGMAQPRITSSMSSLGTCGYLARSARITMAARSSGRVLRSAPRVAFPTGVRRQSTMTASGIEISRFNVAQWGLGRGGGRGAGMCELHSLEKPPATRSPALQKIGNVTKQEKVERSNEIGRA